MKQTWNNPELMELSVKKTASGPYPTEDHDMTTYDNEGKWWAGGQDHS